MREEVRARLSPADQARVAGLAARVGWSGFELTVWLLSNEIDGVTAEDALAMTEMVHTLTATPYHSRTVRYDGGRAYTTVTLPHGAPGGPGGDGPLWCPPVPGKATWTLVEASPTFPSPAAGGDAALGAGPDDPL